MLKLEGPTAPDVGYQIKSVDWFCKHGCHNPGVPKRVSKRATTAQMMLARSS
jgi:hypothetical protein